MREAEGQRRAAGEVAAPAVLLQVQGLRHHYGARVALRGVSFDVRAGEILGLLGPNGAGKTTTLSVLSSLLRPDGGAVELCGVDLLAEPARVRPWLGVVPQELALYPSLGVEANLRFFGGLYGLGGRALDGRVAELLEVSGLRERARDRVSSLSGGMMRRLNLAVALVHGPRLVLLDEPTVGVDPHSRNFLLEHLGRLRAAGLGMVYSTHYMEEAARLCDRVAVLDQGAVRALGTPAELLASLGGGVLRVELGPPGTPADTLALHAALGALRGVQEVVHDGNHHRLVVDEPAGAVAAVAAVVAQHGRRVASLELLPVNLETLFLHLTGHRLRDEQTP